MSSSMKPLASRFESVHSAYNYLVEPCTVEEVVSSTTTSSTGGSTRVTNDSRSIKQFKKEKELANVENNIDSNFKEMGRLLPSGRVKYGPITVNPRKQPSKTLFTGRRSKYEVLSDDAEEKRRVRRDRNRVAATKCRTKRETVQTDLEHQVIIEEQKYNYLFHQVQELNQEKQRLRAILFASPPQCLVTQINVPQPSIASDNTGYLSSIIETSAPVSSTLPSDLLQVFENDQENSGLFLQSTSFLHNSACYTDEVNPMFNNQQPQAVTMTSSGFERLINSLQSPPPDYTNNNRNNSSNLFNSTYDSSSCRPRHLSEIDFASLDESNFYVN